MAYLTKHPHTLLETYAMTGCPQAHGTGRNGTGIGVNP